MGEFTMPALGADMTEGTLVEWLVGPGDQVRKGDIVAVVDTTKSAIEVECFETGTVDRLLVDAGTTVPVGAPLAVISAKGAPETPAGRPARPPAEPAPAAPAAPEPGPAGPPPAPAEPAAGERAVTSTPLVRHLAEDAGVDLAAVHGTGSGGRVTRADVEREAVALSGTGKPGRRGREGREGREGRRDRQEGRTGRVRATPLARRLAEEEGIDLASLTGSGREGAVRAGDVRAAAAGEGGAAGGGEGAGKGAGEGAAEGAGEAAAQGAAEGAGEAAAGGEGGGREGPERYADMRRTTADLMARAKREIPHYYLSTTVDLGTAVAWLRERNRELPVGRRLLTTAVLLKATALAARQVPELNGFWTDDGFDAAPSVHLGVAVSLRGGGLVSAAILDAAELPLPDLMARLRDVVARARGGRLRASESTSATITVTNLGDQGVEAVFGVIHPPQVALVGLGRVVERPWAVNGLLGVRPVVTATLSADHRASDGATGARFLTALDAWAQKPEEL
ncbi:dihydrolipoamide acetyltransferase family protein [Streptomyces sp. HPF1205]|uniref:dihydrolipoamide acetyltransferase family protein n=1 Tax=Streptomyces sp. HPF1205 TaxID=2873262 RepID=UPI001CEC4E6C|nr:dihydrolipoamide acetyltransferase family protein [Streptomyces sp. HPF1205]